MSDLRITHILGLQGLLGYVRPSESLTKLRQRCPSGSRAGKRQLPSTQAGAARIRMALAHDTDRITNYPMADMRDRITNYPMANMNYPMANMSEAMCKKSVGLSEKGGWWGVGGAVHSNPPGHYLVGAASSHSEHSSQDQNNAADPANYTACSPTPPHSARRVSYFKPPPTARSTNKHTQMHSLNTSHSHFLLYP